MPSQITVWSSGSIGARGGCFSNPKPSFRDFRRHWLDTLTHHLLVSASLDLGLFSVLRQKRQFCSLLIFVVVCEPFASRLSEQFQHLQIYCVVHRKWRTTRSNAAKECFQS